MILILETDLEDSVCKVLEAVVEFGGERVDGLGDHRVNERVQLLLGQIHVEPVFHRLHRGRARGEAGKLRA